MAVKFKWTMRMGSKAFVEAGLCLLQGTQQDLASLLLFSLSPMQSASKSCNPLASVPGFPTFHHTKPPSCFRFQIWVSFAQHAMLVGTKAIPRS